MGKKNKVILPPDLPPEISDDEIRISDGEFDFFDEHKPFANQFAKNLDKKSIDKHVTRVADVDDSKVEELYERRRRKSALVEVQEDKESQFEIIDSLPTKTPDGNIVYRTVRKGSSDSKSNEKDAKDAGDKLTKQKLEQKPKLKKKIDDKDALTKKAANDASKDKLHSEVLEMVKLDLSKEELYESKKAKLAEIGTALLEDPESNIRTSWDLLQISKDEDANIVKLCLMSILAVFKDIIPGYRIRPLTEKEITIQVSKEVKKRRYYEYTFLRAYKDYLKRLKELARRPAFHLVVARCVCTLLDTAPHFNFRESLLAYVVKNLSSTDETIRKLCCETVKSLFVNEGKHRGEATFESVRLIADQVKLNDCKIYPESVEVLLSLKFDENVGKPESAEEKEKPKKKKRGRKQLEVLNPLPVNDRKKSREELIAKTREEVNADLKALSFAQDPAERKKMQSETLAATFEILFRILKHMMDQTSSRDGANSVSLPGGAKQHPLLSLCLSGLAKFSHLIDLDFMADLMACLKKLAGYSEYDDSSSHNALSVSERLLCCIVAFKVMRNNLDALNVDLQDFFIQLFNLLLEYRPDRDRGEVLAEALKIMLWEVKQYDMMRSAAFIKRLATFSLSNGPADAMAALITVRHLLQRNSKCRSMLENDSGGGSLSGLVARYQPEATDPYMSGALASVLWELGLLIKHYNPSISSMASGILSMASLKPNQNPVVLSMTSPLQAFSELSIEQELSKPPVTLGIRKRKRRSEKEERVTESSNDVSEAHCLLDEDDVKRRLEDHFAVVKEVSESERMRRQQNEVSFALNLYEEYKELKKRRTNSKAKRSKSGGRLD